MNQNSLLAIVMNDLQIKLEFWLYNFYHLPKRYHFNIFSEKNNKLIMYSVLSNRIIIILKL